MRLKVKKLTLTAAKREIKALRERPTREELEGVQRDLARCQSVLHNTKEQLAAKNDALQAEYKLRLDKNAYAEVFRRTREALDCLAAAPTSLRAELPARRCGQQVQTTFGPSACGSEAGHTGPHAVPYT
jgi:hypothetical protein